METEQPQKRATMDTLYTQNLKLGNRINDLTSQNNFYKIQINNFNKLTKSINKDLYKLGVNFQNKEIMEDSAKIGPLFLISNKIKLKNLQLKIGNSIRNTEKIKKNLQGSVPFLTKQILQLQQQISLLLAKYLQQKQENELLKDINNFRTLTTIYSEQIQNGQNNYQQKYEQLKMEQLEKRKKDSQKKLEGMKKQEKEKSRMLSQLMIKNQGLENKLKKIKTLLPVDIEQNDGRIKEAKELQSLQNKQKQLSRDIQILEIQLKEQYKINKDYKQKIVDKKYQQNKEIKVLEEQVLKCREQVRQFIQKYKKISKGTKENRY